MTRLTGPNLRIQPSTSRELDFPALGRGSESVTASAVPSSTQSWTKITCVKPEDMPRNKKVAPPPLASSPPPIRSGQDFPSLSKTKGKSNSQVLTPSWVQVGLIRWISYSCDFTIQYNKKYRVKGTIYRHE